MEVESLNQERLSIWQIVSAKALLRRKKIQNSNVLKINENFKIKKFSI